MKTYYVYILSSNNKTTIYIGVTNDLQRSKELKGFSSKYNCINLIYFEKHNSIEKAIERETQIKRWKKTGRIILLKLYILIGLI